MWKNTAEREGAGQARDDNIMRLKRDSIGMPDN